MDIQKLIDGGGKVVFMITAEDLNLFALSLIQSQKQELQEFAKGLVDELGLNMKSKVNEGEELYTTDDVCRILKKSKMTLWRWKQPGKNYLIPVRVGGLDLYRKADIKRIIGSSQ